jgi:hypothetical protein
MPTARIITATIVLLLISFLSTSSHAQGFLQDALRGVTSTVSQINRQVQQSSSLTQAKVNELPHPTIEPELQLVLADESDRRILCGKVETFAGHAKSEEQLYSKLALMGLILSACLALFGSIASFLAMNRIAGVISLIVAALIGLSNAYPIGRVADFYGTLAGQAGALSLECDLTKPYTVTTYTSHLNQLKLLYVYEEQKPSFGSYKVATDELTKQMQGVKTASNNLATAQTVNSRIESPIWAGTNSTKDDAQKP